MNNKLGSFFKGIIKGRHLPCYTISHEPMIIISYWFDFINNIDAIAKALASNNKVHCLFQLGWHVETNERLEEISRDFEILKSKGFDQHYTFLANSPTEEELLLQHGFKATYCHQNAFVDEKRYKLIPTSKRYDAIYIARITSFKRHHLAKGIDSLKLVGSYKESEDSHFKTIIKQLSHAQWTEKVSANKIDQEICEATAGLCLSAEEGAMFVSIEYLLCGIPIVSTKSLGGRQELFSEAHTRIVDDDSDDIADAVQDFKTLNLDPEEIRREALLKMQAMREVFIDLIQGIYDREGVDRKFKDEWRNVFYHKFGLRSSPSRAISKNRMLK